MAYEDFKDLNRRTAADHVFSMIWLVEILKIYTEEQLLITHYMIKHLISPKIQKMIDPNLDFLQWFKNILIKNFS